MSLAAPTIFALLTLQDEKTQAKVMERKRDWYITAAMALDFPRLFLLPTHLQPPELHELEDRIPSLTYDINEADIILGKITKRERVLFELRRFKLETEPLQPTSQHGASVELPESPSPKRRKVSGDTYEAIGSAKGNGDGHDGGEQRVKVLRLAWLTDSLEQGTVLPVDEYLLYEGRKVPPKTTTSIESSPVASSPVSGKGILKRAIGDQSGRLPSNNTSPNSRHPRTPANASSLLHRPKLSHQTTSEHDIPLPLIPEFLKTTYSCQRPTPSNPPNDDFIEALKNIRTIRLLDGDKVGVRAYSTAIATISAYPYALQTPDEVARLPGCSAKIAELFQQWKSRGHLEEALEAESDPHISVLKVFYEIWGVGDTTAREFYRKGWRDLDDLVLYGWGSLSRVQQIGVKFYDEFLLKIPRPEVVSIGAIVLKSAHEIDSGFEMVIVGGYRRGKKASGDVDVLLSHRDESLTSNLVEKIVMKLEKGNRITHTLSLTTRNTQRGQEPVAWKGESTGSGFDTLDKALVVWKDPTQDGSPHRRVDIIISPWKTVGCAVLGWSGGTTFQRDVRRYCKKEKGWKFDSSGIRDRANGMWVDLEGSSSGDHAPDMETAERRVFEGLGLPWRPPEERCTG